MQGETQQEQGVAPDLLRDYLTKDEAAAALSVHPFTLKRWRMSGYGPKSVKVGGRLRYRLSDLETWLAELGKGQQSGRQ